MYEWDEAKRLGNLPRHGIDFHKATRFEWTTSIQQIDARWDYGEVRWQALGLIDGRLHMLVFTAVEGRTRNISLRKAKKQEQVRYAKTLPDPSSDTREGG